MAAQDLDLRILAVVAPPACHRSSSCHIHRHHRRLCAHSKSMQQYRQWRQSPLSPKESNVPRRFFASTRRRLTDAAARNDHTKT